MTGGGEIAVPLSLMRIGGLFIAGLGWGLDSMRGGGIPVS